MIVADENIEQYWIALLRSHGFEVLSIRERHGGISDREVIEIVRSNSGLLLTEDKDFGELVYAHGFKDLSVILLRYDQPQYHTIEKMLVNIIKEYFNNPKFCFITITKNKVRVRNL